LRDVVRGKDIVHFSLESTIEGLAFSPDGRLLAAALSDGTMSIWDAAGQALAEVKGERGGFHSIAFSPDGKTIFTGGSDTTVTLWDVEEILGQAKPPLGPLSPAELDELWKRLGDPDASEAAKTMRRLQRVPEPAVRLLRQRLQPIATVEAKRVEQLVAELEDERFEVRRRAADELSKLAELAEPFLRKRLEKKPPLDVQQRVQTLIDKSAGFITDPDKVRSIRAVELLERIGAAEAQDLLRELARGAREARLTIAARAALDRLVRRSVNKP